MIHISFSFQHVASDPPTAKSLSTLISQMIQFQEENLGNKSGASNKAGLARLPIRHFLNFLPDGSLCHILAAMYKFKSDQGWRRFDLTSPSRKEINVQVKKERKKKRPLLNAVLNCLPLTDVLQDRGGPD